MKKLMNSVLSLVVAFFTMVSCDETYTDLMTADVKTGGILMPTSGIPYKLGGTPNFKITINIPKGPGIEAVEIYKTYTEYTTDGKVKNVKGPVLDRSVSISSQNASQDFSTEVTFDYTQLVNGLSMPADERVLAIGDAWTFSYVSVMEDGRKVDVAPKTSVTVANKYAGYYQCEGTFFHPTAGPRPVSEEKFLTPIDANTCWGNAGDLGASGYFVKIYVNPADNKVTCSTYKDIEMANMAGEPNYWDPVTGEFHLSYFYIGGSGPRIMREVWTPIP